MNDPHEAYTGNHIGHRERGALPKHTASLFILSRWRRYTLNGSQNKGFVKGKNPEGLPVSKGRGMYEEKHYGTWETLTVPEKKEKKSGRRVQREEGGGPKTVRESYSLIVLRDGRADHRGKG